jgi:protein SCO1/2
VEGLSVGDKVLGTYYLSGDSSWAGDLQKVGTETKVFRKDVSPLRIGETFPITGLTLDDGSEFLLGKDHDKPIALTFIYTRCPDSEACPAMIARFQALHAEMKDEAMLLAITLDPAYDKPEILASYAEMIGVSGSAWHFAWVEQDHLEELALRAGMNVLKDEAKIVHGLRVLVMDKTGTLIERYDDTRWPLDRVSLQLRTGEPKAPIDTLGSHYPKP